MDLFLLQASSSLFGLVAIVDLNRQHLISDSCDRHAWLEWNSGTCIVELKIRIQCSSHELTFASKNCTIQKILTMFNNVAANELFSSFELWISREGSSLIKIGMDVLARALGFSGVNFCPGIRLLAIFDKNV